MKYKYVVELSWTNPAGETYVIDTTRIKVMYIKSDYENNYMPIIIINIDMANNLCDDIILNKDNAFFIFTLKKYKDTGEYVIQESYVGVSCMYVLMDELNFEQSLSKDVKEEEDYHRNINIGLIRTDLVKQNHCDINTVASSDILGFLMKYTHINNLLVQPISANYNGLVPPISKTSDLIKFLNDQVGPFYSTPYRFFIDHDRTYLISYKHGGIFPLGYTKDFKVSLEVLDPSDERIRFDGVEYDLNNKLVYVTVDARRTSFYIDNTQSVKVNKITMVDDDGTIGSTDVDLMNRNDMTGLNQYIWAHPSELNNTKFAMELNNKRLTVSLDESDNSIFTINRVYEIKNYNKLSKFDGEYALMNKLEGFIQENGVFKSSITLTFKKIPA